MATQEMNRSSLPPYSEMIYAALDALNEKMGSNKTSISKYIESKYGSLPTGHSTLLRHHLNRMKENGELIFWKNNYMKPNPNFIRRGRGRPRKPKGPDGHVVASSFPPVGLNMVDGPTSSSSAADNPLAVPFKKKETRGRPRKYPRPEESDVLHGAGTGSNLMLGGGAKKRGRPLKDNNFTVGSSF